jgi:hypothetical protein
MGIVIVLIIVGLFIWAMNTKPAKQPTVPSVEVPPDTDDVGDADDTDADLEVPPKNPDVPPKDVEVPPKDVEIPPKNPDVPPKNPDVPPKDVEVPPKDVEVPPSPPPDLVSGATLPVLHISGKMAGGSMVSLFLDPHLKYEQLVGKSRSVVGTAIENGKTTKVLDLKGFVRGVYTSADPKTGNAESRIEFELDGPTSLVSTWVLLVSRHAGGKGTCDSDFKGYGILCNAEMQITSNEYISLILLP